MTGAALKLPHDTGQRAGSGLCGINGCHRVVAWHGDAGHGPPDVDPFAVYGGAAHRADLSVTGLRALVTLVAPLELNVVPTFPADVFSAVNAAEHSA